VAGHNAIKRRRGVVAGCHRRGFPDWMRDSEVLNRLATRRTGGSAASAACACGRG
jgi:hypothetical protein